MYFCIKKMSKKRCQCKPWSREIEDWITDEWNDIYDRCTVFTLKRPIPLDSNTVEFVCVEPHDTTKYFYIAGRYMNQRTDEHIKTLRGWMEQNGWFFQLSHDRNIYKKFTYDSYFAEKNGFIDNKVQNILLLTIYEHHQEKVKYGKKQIKSIERIIFDGFLMKGIMRY